MSFQLAQNLKSFSPFDAKEKQDLARLQNFIASDSTAFERTNTHGHVTGSVWIVTKPPTKVLLLHHKKLGYWMQPGGHSDGNPNTLAVAQREMEEETGLQLAPTTIFDIDIHAIPASSKMPEHLHYDVIFLCVVDAPVAVTINPTESNGALWTDLDQVSEYNPEPRIARMVQKTKELSWL